jgi:hypothetical protein
MRKAWIVNGQISDIACKDPYEIYHPDVAKLYDTEVPDDAANGDGWIDGKWIKPTIPEPSFFTPDPVDRMIGLSQIRQNLTFAEKVKWDNNKTDEIITAKEEFILDLKIPKAAEILQFLVDSGSISQASANNIIGDFPAN